MKQLKRLLSLGLALVLTFCTLSAGMVVHAEEETGVAEAKITDAFAFIKVDGEEIDLEKCPEQYISAERSKATATIEWELKDGWTLGDAAVDGKSIQNGEELAVETNFGSWVYMFATDESNQTMVNYTLQFFCGKVKPMISGTLWAGMGAEKLMMENLYVSDVQVVSLSSSKTDVLAVTKGKTLEDCKVTPKKAGKSKVTVVLKINGEEKTFSGNIAVKKYPNAIKSLKVAGKGVNFKKNPYSYSAKKSKAKIEFKLASGWKMVSAGYVHNNDSSSYVDIKSGKTVKVGKKGTMVYLYMLDKKGNVFNYTINLKR